MKVTLFALVIVVSSAACTSSARLEFPVLPDPPANWSQWSLSTLSNSDCPIVGGTYRQPPLIYRSGEKAEFLPNDNMDLQSGYIPFFRADRKEKALSSQGFQQNDFEIRQPNSAEFHFSYVNENKTLIVEYHFRSDEGDFNCNNGFMEFPLITNYLMVEGTSVNFQIRNILMKDKDGALILQSTRGPYHGNPSSNSNVFSYEFFRYSLVPDSAGTLQN